MATLVSMQSPAASAHHLAQFYDDAAFLAARVASFFGEALASGGAAVAVARAEHLSLISRELVGRGHDVGALRAQGRMLLIDANELLAQIAIDGAPCRDRFHAVVGDLVARTFAECREAGRVHIYGEMVDILWSDGRGAEMMQLEDLWNELAAKHPFSLLCGYRLAAFADQRHVKLFNEVCDRHAEVAPTERLLAARSCHEAARTIAELEQRASSLQIEIARRQATELHLEQLLEVSSELAGAITREDIARITIEKGLVAVGAATGGLWVIDGDDDDLVMIGVSALPSGGAERWARVPLASNVPITRVVRDGEPLFIESVAHYREQFPASFERIRDTMIGPEIAYAMVPLVGKERTLGVLSLAYQRATRLESSDRTFLSILARQCALALERVRLHEIERALRLQAEAATRGRDEILAVVSHDLRNPLGTILMGASTLLAPADPLDKKAQRIATIGQRIHRQAERMARQIEDLVDFATIQGGKLALTRAPKSPHRIIEQVASTLGPIVSERGVAFDSTVNEGLPEIHCDEDRAVQALSCLIVNAVKVTPRNGKIEITAAQRDGSIVFSVSDTGPGIEADELPGLFDATWRSRHAGYKGAGLGLSIAHGIVTAHGGRIWAESTPGAGSRFSFTLDSN